MKSPFAAVVPVFNPEPPLKGLCERLLESFDLVVVVDDGSVEHQEDFRALPPAVVLLRHAANRGKGEAMKTALRFLLERRPDIAGAVFADGDGQHDVADVLAVAARAATTDSVVFGVRDFSAKNVPFRSWWGNRWTAWEVFLLFGFRVRDTQTGLRAVPRRLFAELAALRGSRFEFEAAWFPFLRRRGEAIVEVPVKTIYVASNRASHFRPLRDTLLTQRALFGR